MTYLDGKAASTRDHRKAGVAGCMSGHRNVGPTRGQNWGWATKKQSTIIRTYMHLHFSMVKQLLQYELGTNNNISFI